MRISVAEDFTTTPGPRDPDEGPFSGVLFLTSVLHPAYRKARAAGDTLTVDLDGTEGYATSFLEAAFGGLARIEPIDEVQRFLRVKSEEEPFLEREVKQYIEEARQPA
jgi:hypothetical protein